MKRYAVFICFLLVASCHATQISIDDCSKLDDQGATYILTEDIFNSSITQCMNITETNITLDCQNHIIEGRDLNESIGIYTWMYPLEYSGINIKNCIVRNWYAGIYMIGANFNTVTDVNTSSNTYEFFIYFGSNNDFSNINAASSDGTGFMLFQSPNNSFSNINVTNTPSIGFAVAEGSNNNSFTNVNVSSSSYTGFYITNSDSNTLREVYVTDGKTVGLSMQNSSYNIILDSRASSNNGAGLLLDNSGNNTIRNFTSSSNTEYGIYLYQSSNNSINKATSTENHGSGFYLYESHSNYIKDSTTSLNNDTGFFIYRSGYNTLTDSYSTSNNITGISIGGNEQEGANRIYNNFFNNTNNFLLDQTGNPNYWNTTKKTGKRICSQGTEIGGNFWASPVGGGYSETCTDADENGFCDSEYDLIGENIDYMPLSNKYKSAVTLSEVIMLINKWASGQASLSQVISLINAWAAG